MTVKPIYIDHSERQRDCWDCETNLKKTHKVYNSIFTEQFDIKNAPLKRWFVALEEVSSISLHVAVSSSGNLQHY